jgi:hypothetical protein
MASTGTDRTTGSPDSRGAVPTGSTPPVPTPAPRDQLTDDDYDLIARYLFLKLTLACESHARYGGSAQAPQVRKWQEQLEESKRELIVNGLAIEI